MIIVNVAGGLGNQMFQYAFGRYLSVRFDKALFLNNTAFETRHRRAFGLNAFNLPANCHVGDRDNLLQHAKTGDRLIQVRERFFHYDQALVDSLKEASRDDAYRDTIFVISGYWQSAKYFEEISATIVSDFGFKYRLEGDAETLHARIKSGNAVMVHVRRGDYLLHLDKLGVVSKDYLLRAIGYCRRKLTSPEFYVFSDDIPWCKDQLSDVTDLTFVDDTFYEEHNKSYLQLMCSCRHFIISNSTYSWWASWLSENKNGLTIAPRQWFVDDGMNTKDIYMPGWIRL